VVATTAVGSNAVTRPFINADGELVTATRNMRAIIEDSGTKSNAYWMSSLLMYAIRNDRLVRAAAGVDVTQNIAGLTGWGTHTFTDPIEALNVFVSLYPIGLGKYGDPPWMYQLGRIAPMYGGYIGTPIDIGFEKQRVDVNPGCDGIWYALYPEVAIDVSVLSTLETIQVTYNEGGGDQPVLG